jgi:predicted GIY-YIG superfamily endonuclease
VWAISIRGKMEELDAVEWLHSLARKASANEPKENSGFIYILKSSNGYYKIGRAKEVNVRVAAWKTVFPIKIKLVNSFACKNRMAVENALHNKYAKKRLEREWYKLEKEDVNYLMSIKDYELG